MRTENLLISFVAGHAIKRFHGPKKVSFLSLLSRKVYTKSPFKKTKSSKLKSKQFQALQRLKAVFIAFC